MSKKTILAGAAAAALTGTLLAGMPAEAATTTVTPAATPYCPTGYACMWRDIHYVTDGNAGHYFKMYYYAPDLSAFYYSGTGYNVNKSISSEFNAGTGGDPVYYYKGKNCTSSTFSSAAGTGDSDFTNGSPSGNFNDAVQSASFLSELSNC